MAKRKTIETSIEDANVETIQEAPVIEGFVSKIPITDENTVESEKVNNVVYSKNYFESEILFKINTDNQNLSEKFDFTDALIDLNFIRGLERAVLSRLEDLGLSPESMKEYNIAADIYPFVYSTAYPNGVLVLDMSYDELKTMLVEFNS